MGISAGESRDKSRSISRDKNHPGLTGVWSRSKGMGEGEQEERIGQVICYTYIVCPKSKRKGSSVCLKR